ncbi:chromosome segregation protein SMC [Methanorbis furvi]|uniref:Chromosome partition protein Smc n=1 Tax=Methanorbis furvi TaxID=3028299 RepID=A0AAE4MBR5_9EURY|nr:Chromosome partition protein Smc [Methanocorpusculaceae archaeon Ag1]
MHIVQVDIDNFKSFSRKTKIPFYEGFTVISGPNGSGKSNIIDSILFVLSLSSARSLRAEKLTDLINNISGKHTAEVTLTFSDETKIRRRIKRTPSGYYSYYYLNERLCTQTDVLAYLSKYGIKPHGYNVVMQGDVTRIMEMSDLDRRRMIDEIAGVAEFDSKKEQALTELEQVRARIEREELLLADLAARIEELKEAREGAVKYQKLQTELDYFRAARQVAQLRDLERELSTIALAKTDQETELVRINESVSLETHERSCRMEDVKDIDRQISEKSGPEYIKLLADLEAERGNIRVADQTISRLKKEKDANLSSMNDIFIDMKRFENSLADKNKESRQLQIDRANLAMEHEAQKKILDQVQVLMDKKSKDSEGAQTELISLMGQIEDQKAERSTILSERDGIIERSRIRAQESERMKRLQTQLLEERAEKQGEIASLERELSEKQKEKSVFDKQIGEADRSMMSCRRSLEPIRGEIQQLTQKMMRLEAQQQVSAESNRAISAVLEMNGVSGTIARLGKVPSEYTTALNIAAGGRLHNVVVDTDQTASDAIRYLKEERLGRVTFLPLNKIKPPAPLPPVAGSGVVDYAINLVEFDEQYRNAFSLVFGQTVVVETLEAGRRLMGRFRMVTLDGELLEKAGAMTGGSIRKDIHGFGAAVDKESAVIGAKLSALRAEEADLTAAESRNKAVADGLRSEKSEIDAAVTKLELTIAEANRRLDAIADEELSLNESLSGLEHDAKEVSAKVAELEVRQDALTDQITVMNDRISEIRKVLDESEFTLLTEKLQKARREADDVKRRLDTKEADLLDVNRDRQYFKKRLDERTADKDALAAKNAKLDEEISACNQQIENAKSAIAALEEKQKSFTGELEVLRNERAALQAKVDESQARLLSLNSEIERCRVQISALDEKAASVSSEIEEIRGTVTDEVECTLSMDEIEEGMATTERAIRKLGAVNMLAIEQYDEAVTKSAERTARKDVLSREREALLERIESFAKMKFEAFMEAYLAINANFQDIFARLTMGSGHLVLDSPEDPFLGGMTFEVRPRDKEVHRLNMMSGGEKSLTTLSFIFAIQRYMPAPFYAFDEVDMSLDGANVERISQMVREMCSSSQFVIVSLRKPMIEAADRIMGVTIRPDKSTLVTGVKTNV